MPVMKEWAYENLGIAKEDLEKYVAEARVKADDRAGRDYAVNHNRLVRFQCMLETLGKPVFPYAYEMYNLYWDTLIDQIIPSPGIEELMKELKQRGIYIGIGSNMTSDVQYRKILKLGLGKYIDGIVTSEEAGAEKPHRKIFDLCVEKAGVAMEESVFIGDSIAHDVNGAQNVGMPVILYRPKEDTKEVSWLQTEKGRCPVITHFSTVFLRLKKMFEKKLKIAIKKLDKDIKRRHRKNMKLVEKVPKDLYKIFGSKYMEFYMQFLVALYEESSQSYSLLGLTERECQMIMNERLAKMALDWSEARVDEEGELITRANMASVSLKHFEDWGWLRRDYDETLNSYVVSFPEYSQLFVELFQKLYSENDGKERESVLTVYSHLYTYSLDKEKNNEILKSALHTSRALLQMLANMQEGMRGYFDELSKQRSFRGIQEVLVKEINNSDSKKYAILTTTDSFYRYKEAVKELIEENLEKTEARKYSFETELLSEEENTRKSYRLRRMIEICEEATDMLYKISREFDAIERRYNKLIEQKTVFASRAAARIRYIMMEGVMEEDQTVALINLINESGKSEEILDKLSSKLRFSEPYKIMTEKSLYQRRENQKEKFTPQAVTPEKSQEENMTEFVLEPLYTQKEIRDFRKKNEQNGKFTVTKDTVKSIEDLEKLFMVWQHATESADSKAQIEVAQEMENEAGFRFSKLTIEGVESDG